MVEERDELEDKEIKYSNEHNSLEVQTDRTEKSDQAPVGTNETEQLKDQIEETRSQMGETIGAIQEKLTYTNISEQVSDQVNNAVETAKLAVYDATVGKVTSIMQNLSKDISGNTIVRTAKQHPIPFILIGVGAGLLAYQTLGAKPSKTRTTIKGNGKSDESNGNSSLENATNTISGVADKVSGAAGSVYNKVTDAAETVYSGASGAVGSVYNKAGELTTGVRSRYETQIEENPLAVGALALAVGAAVGMAIPSTNYEGKLMGEARQGMIEKVQNTATEVIDKTKEAVTEAGRTIADQARAAIAE